MISRNDFIEAIGKPDADFCEAVDSALAVIRAREERKKPRRYHMILPVAAAAAIFVGVMSMALNGGFAPRNQQSGVMAQPKRTPVASVMPAVTASAEELDETVYTPAPVPTIEAESTYAPENEPENEVFYTVEPVEETTAVPDNEVYPTEEPMDMDEAESGNYASDVVYVTFDRDMAERYLDSVSGCISALYPGFSITVTTDEKINAYGEHQDCVAQWVNNGTHEMVVAWVTRRAPEAIPEYMADAQNGTLFYALTIDVPCDAARIEQFLSTAPDWMQLQSVYVSAMMRLHDELGDDTGHMLTGVMLYIDDAGEPAYCEMYFDGAPAAYMLWHIEPYDDGSSGFELLLDEYGVYEFNDVFGDPDVDVSVEYTPAPENAVQYADAVVYETNGSEAADKLYAEKIFDIYMPYFVAMHPNFESYSVSCENVVMDGIAMSCYALGIEENGGQYFAGWITHESPEIMMDGTFNTLNIPVDDESLLSVGDALTETMYASSLDIMTEYAADSGPLPTSMPLCGMKFYLNTENKPVFCEMYFGNDVQFRALWAVGDDSVEIMETGVNDVRFAYDFVTEAYETHEVSVGGWLKDIITSIGDALNLPSASIGVIGGADGPTQVYVGSSISAETVAVPEYYRVFSDTVGMELAELWPGAYFYGTSAGTVTSRGVQYPCENWILKGGEEFTAAWLTLGEVVEGNVWEGEYSCPTISVLMPADPDQTEAFMSKANEWLFDMYYKSRDYVGELMGDENALYNGWQLAGMKLTFDELQQVKICELFFGEEEKIYFQWLYDDEKDTYALITQYYDENGEFFSDYFGTPGAFVFPEDKDMFQYVFGDTVDALYPGNGGLYIKGSPSGSDVLVKYDSGDRLAYVVDHNIERQDAEFVSITAYMPDDEEIVENFMNAVPAWLSELYFSEDQDRQPLAEINVTIASDGSVYDCQMCFGTDETEYIRWLRCEDGTFTIVESGGSIKVE